MKKYELILFDFDGTLVDSMGDIAYHANRTLEHYGYPRKSTMEVQLAVGWGVHELLRLLERGFVSVDGRLEEAVDFFKKSYEAAPIRSTRVYPHVREALEGPLSGIKKAVVTNKPQDITKSILKELKLDTCFQMVVGINAGHPPKPDPSGTQYVMSALSVSPQKTFFIGDSDVDFNTSANAGIDFGWVDYGYHQLKEKPHTRFSSAAEWAKIVA